MNRCKRRQSHSAVLEGSGLGVCHPAHQNYGLVSSYVFKEVARPILYCVKVQYARWKESKNLMGLDVVAVLHFSQPNTKFLPIRSWSGVQYFSRLNVSFTFRSVSIISFCIQKTNYNSTCYVVLRESQWPHGIWRGICCRSHAEIAGSTPAGGMDVCLLWVLCVVR